jgi:hypothetical protein
MPEAKINMPVRHEHVLSQYQTFVEPTRFVAAAVTRIISLEKFTTDIFF